MLNLLYNISSDYTIWIQLVAILYWLHLKKYLAIVLLRQNTKKKNYICFGDFVVTVHKKTSYIESTEENTTIISIL